ncbi:uncharacterized protein LOC107641330 [Arachis ipaensis]|uniref:uncharacterized protein LOC107641330 n=1 Tax=Arachis ipaensis TaxID=130454 RepID=UPI0007AEFBFF|nr:uncharacterized protein LOC107641330 [Arachis ipaensis]
MYFLLTTLKVAYVLTIPRPPEVEREAIVKTRAKQKWDNDDYICTGHILNGIADALFDVYQNQGCRKDQENEDASTITTPILEGSSNFITSSSPLNSSKRPRLLPNQLDVFRLERDPGMRPMIWKFPPNKRDEIHWAYIKVGPNQPILDNYPFSGDKSHRRFQASWFKLFPSLLEYSIEDDAIYCFPCFLFAKEPSINTGSNAFIENGFRNWKKVNSKKECALLNHIGKDPNSFHHKALKSCDDLMKQSQHIDRLLHKQTSEEIEKNRIRLGASIDCIRWLTFQGCAYRGHDESQSSSNRARDESKKEQMAIVLRFVTLDGFVKERFFDLVHVTDTCATTLKKELIFVLSHYNLQVKNIRGQGYDGASNMRGEWNGLQALFLKDSPQAYYVHCFAYRLQLALVAASRELLLQQLRDGGWCNFLANVKDFCEKHEIEVLNMSAQYVFGRGRSRQPSVTVEHHYRIDVFLTTIDSQIQELNSRFNEQTIELLTLSCALDPKDNFKSFNIEEISKLAEKFYPIDFPSNELNILKSQLQYYQHDIPNHLKGIGTLSELCNKLQETGKSRTYHMVDRLIRLVLTLSVSTATTERAFSAMKIVKTRLRSKMADEFLADNLIIYIEKELAAIFDTNSIIDDFENRKKRRIVFS